MFKKKKPELYEPKTFLVIKTNGNKMLYGVAIEDYGIFGRKKFRQIPVYFDRQINKYSAGWGFMTNRVPYWVPKEDAAKEAIDTYKRILYYQWCEELSKWNQKHSPEFIEYRKYP